MLLVIEVRLQECRPEAAVGISVFHEAIARSS